MIDLEDVQSLQMVSVFEGGEGSFWRIPGMIMTRKGTVLATCQHRIDSVEDSGHDIAIAQNRSLDGGTSWSGQRDIVREKGVTFWQGALVEDRESSTLLLPYVNFPATQSWQSFYVEHGQKGGGFWIMRSIDEGQTWSEPSWVKVEQNPLGWTGFPDNAVHGIQLSEGPHAGRLVIPAKLFKEGEQGFLPGIRGGLLYSDDGGRTWSVGAVMQRGSDESVIAEASGGTVYANLRYNKWFSEKRGFGRSVDGGANFKNVGNHKGLNHPPCHAGLVRASDWDGHGDALLFSHPRKRRQDLGMYVSRNDGKSWTYARSIYPGPAGYSDLVVTPNGQVLCLFENGRDTAKERISVACFERDWLSATENCTSSADVISP